MKFQKKRSVVECEVLVDDAGDDDSLTSSEGSKTNLFLTTYEYNSQLDILSSG